jgi:hypothetical protein
VNTSAFAAVAAGIALTASPAAADIVWDEAINGDLSSDNLNPSFLSFNPGSNMVFGDTTPNPDLDPDFFSFDIPIGYELSSVVFVEYNRSDFEQSFVAIEVGSQITSTGDPSALLTAALIGSVPDSSEGDELIDDLRRGNVFGGFQDNLGAGTYTFWYQETGVTTDYGFDFVLTPIPAPASVSLLSGGLLLVRRRR